MDSALFNSICDEISETIDDSIHDLCKKHATCWSAFWKFKEENDDAETRYAHARKAQIEHLFDLIHYYEAKMLAAVQECDPKCSNAVATAYKIKIDNLKWILSKLNPAKYGDKIDLTSGGEKLKPPIINVTTLEHKEQLDKLVNDVSTHGV